MARTARVTIKLTESMRDELEQIAINLGLTISSLGAYVLGKYIYENKAAENTELELELINNN